LARSCHRGTLVVTVALVLAIAGIGGGCAPEQPDPVEVAIPRGTIRFAEDVQPILAEHCFPCHGPDASARRAGLRLDTSEGMFAARPSGLPAVVRGDPGSSVLVQRIKATNVALRMPPAGASWPLSAAQIAIVEKWVAEGAAYARHWAFEKPVRSAPPSVRDHSWLRQPLDRFVLAKLETAGLTPSPEADPRTLLRRASLDIRGLPPTADEVEAFLVDAARSPGAYEAWVDRFLADPAYGEHRAHFWLDVARYADTHGFEYDNYRSVWPYRDYVVRAFNDNLPFDVFTIEQLAGDLLPEATEAQRIATGFGRCAMSTAEGGTIEAEFAAIAAKDRVETVSAAWMGLTVGCAACHDHKFDPIAQREFYELTAFFRNTTQPVFDGNIADVPPVVLVGAEKTPTLVTVEKTDAPFAYVLERGQYDQPRERVTPDVPRVLPRIPAGRPANRLGLAYWLVSPENPLTARVVANRFWAEVFGVGVVATPENFGVTGAAPTDQRLLDWLAVELRESGWDVKHLFRLILTSATYRQAATHNPAGDAADPDNLLLWHGPRFRMDGEMIRDQALAASGLLVRKLGGPPVKPYQPAGLWEAVAIDASNTAQYAQDAGEALFRRSVYTFWKRASPPPSLEIFNAPSRETTVVQRERTNTPLQALAVMNDPQQVEAARHLAVNALVAVAGADGAAADNARLDHMALRLLGRPFDADENAILRQSLGRLLARYESDPEAASRLLEIGDTPVDTTIPAATQAAWTMVAGTILNLDEALNK
jgi:hypothetical protein